MVRGEARSRGLLLSETLGDILADPLYFLGIDALDDMATFASSQRDVMYVRILDGGGRMLADSKQSDYPSGVADELGMTAIQSGQIKMLSNPDVLEMAAPIRAGRDVIGVATFGLSSAVVEAEIREITVQ